jgi:thimet oligopeptidase
MNICPRNACIFALLLLPFAADALKTAAQTAALDPLHSWVSGKDPAALESWVSQTLAEEQAAIDKLLAVTGTRTVENTLRPFDDAQNLLALANNNAYMTYSLAGSAALRDKGQELTAKISSVNTELSLNPKVYAALAAVPLPANDPPTRHYLERTLLEYRLSGVDKDDAARAKIQALQDKITSLSLAFGRNVADGTLKITATRAELDGLPADYIALHKPAANGTYTLTTK